MLPGRPANVLNGFVATCLSCLRFLSHLHSPSGHYDEPEILSYAIPLICSIGADVRQTIDFPLHGALLAADSPYFRDTRFNENYKLPRLHRLYRKKPKVQEPHDKDIVGANREPHLLCLENPQMPALSANPRRSLANP